MGFNDGLVVFFPFHSHHPSHENTVIIDGYMFFSFLSIIRQLLPDFHDGLVNNGMDLGLYDFNVKWDR